MTIRQLNEADGDNYVSLEKQLCEETFYNKNELARDHADLLGQLWNNPRSIIFVAQQDHHLIGRIIVCRETSHPTARIAIGVCEAFQGQGVGKALIEKAIEWARDQKIKRVELTVAQKNKKALWLFSRTGFKVEGTRKQSVKYQDDFEDEFYMGLLLS